MLVKSKQSKRSGRHRQVRGEHGAGRLSAPSPSVPAREARHGGPSLDRALYTCECGYAFEAVVTTSVGCPHCTRTQAW
ncbi:MAG: hypothetical protein JO262_14555 [Solirubrobacterales bacterium]|nr:hypothetical protein [Solirubrobacterales bacterium]MBV9943342.1 hypothetical protein [Solirubrobacterales bacterium]